MDTLARRLIQYRLSFKPKITQAGMVRILGGCSLESYRKWEMDITMPNEQNRSRVEEVLKEKNI